MQSFKLNEADILSNQDWMFPTNIAYGPGRLKEIVEIKIPREKRIWSDMNQDKEFISARDRILKSVREEVLVAVEE